MPSRSAGLQTALALDYGLRRIGVATAAPVAGTASALTTLAARAGEPDWAALDTLVREWEPQALVLGLPRNSDGTESAMTVRVREFEQQLTERYKLPIYLVDERYTSAEAESLLKAQRRSGQRTRKLQKRDVDSLAAALIAASWIRTLDRTDN
ncbi:MAG: Holliday junction resolvase RuvX [Gammaproteobacteria bacterium]|jgi:putative Holliday junction resolvase|nr:Holliday junction resolvase RuvX [Gammaproteobacteria bacterium]